MIRAKDISDVPNPVARRRCRPGLIAFLVLSGLASTFAHAATGADARTWGTVSVVTRGTQLTVMSPDQGQLQVRLVGVDLPELARTGAGGAVIAGQPFGEQAADYVRELLLGRQVQLDSYGKDRTGRLQSVVWLGEINVNLTLVKEGFAWVDPSLTITNVRAALEVAEKQAQVGRYGLWSLPDPEPPWEYRKRYKLAPR
jgi:endonuclease YncB( thermonuclease family)